MPACEKQARWPPTALPPPAGHLRHDPGFKLAVGKLPGGGIGLASQPTMSRWENAPTTRELVRMMDVMVDIYCASYPKPPAAVTLDIDETVDVVHGGQQLHTPWGSTSVARWL